MVHSNNQKSIIRLHFTKYSNFQEINKISNKTFPITFVSIKSVIHHAVLMYTWVKYDPTQISNILKDTCQPILIRFLLNPITNLNMKIPIK